MCKHDVRLHLCLSETCKLMRETHAYSALTCLAALGKIHIEHTFSPLGPAGPCREGGDNGRQLVKINQFNHMSNIHHSIHLQLASSREHSIKW